jgi:hypothetical protein
MRSEPADLSSQPTLRLGAEIDIEYEDKENWMVELCYSHKRHRIIQGSQKAIHIVFPSTQQTHTSSVAQWLKRIIDGDSSPGVTEERSYVKRPWLFLIAIVDVKKKLQITTRSLKLMSLYDL